MKFLFVFYIISVLNTAIKMIFHFIPKVTELELYMHLVWWFLKFWALKLKILAPTLAEQQTNGDRQR